MTRARATLGLISGVILLLSSAAHSLLGWKQLRSELESARIPSDLVFSVAIGWHFGGVAMLAFGCLVIWLFVKRLKGVTTPSFPALVVALAYLAFGTWAFILSKLNPFFFVFIVPGVLLALALCPPLKRGAGQ